jgi:hypothetical protein
MREATLDFHDDRLVLLVADHDALENPFRHARYILWLGTAPLAGNRFCPRDIAPYDTHPRRILKLTRRPLKAQIELLLLEVQDFLFDLIDAHHAQIRHSLFFFHRAPTPRYAG